MTESDSLWKALLVEFLGTFTLVFVGSSAVAMTIAQGGSLLTSAIAFGLALMTIIYVWGSYSGAHVNPAVSFGFAVAGQMNWGLMLGYWIAQLLGAIAAAALVAYFFGTANGAGASVGSATNNDAWKAILMEAFLTFFLVIAYLYMYRNPMMALISGVVIGAVLAFATIVGGPISGGSTNPARSFGPAIFSNNLGTIWIYIVGPLLGALVAALVYKLFTANFDCCYKTDECGKRCVDECGRNILVCKRPLFDKCGKPVTEACGKQQFEEYERVEHHLGYKQDTLKRELFDYAREHGIDLRKLNDLEMKGKCGIPMVEVMTPAVVTPVIATPVVATPAAVMPPSTPSGILTPPNLGSSDVVQSVPRVTSPQGFRTTTAASPYQMPRF